MIGVSGSTTSFREKNTRRLALLLHDNGDDRLFFFSKVSRVISSPMLVRALGVRLIPTGTSAGGAAADMAEQSPSSTSMRDVGCRCLRLRTRWYHTIVAHILKSNGAGRGWDAGNSLLCMNLMHIQACTLMVIFRLPRALYRQLSAVVLRWLLAEMLRRLEGVRSENGTTLRYWSRSRRTLLICNM